MQLLFWKRKNFSPAGAQRKAKRCGAKLLIDFIRATASVGFEKSGYQSLSYWFRSMEAAPDRKVRELLFLPPKQIMPVIVVVQNIPKRGGGFFAKCGHNLLPSVFKMEDVFNL